MTENYDVIAWLNGYQGIVDDDELTDREKAVYLAAAATVDPDCKIPPHLPLMAVVELIQQAIADIRLVVEIGESK